MTGAEIDAGSRQRYEQFFAVIPDEHVAFVAGVVAIQLALRYGGDGTPADTIRAMLDAGAFDPKEGDPPWEQTRERARRQTTNYRNLTAAVAIAIETKRPQG